MRTPLARLLATLLALSLVAAACGGDSDEVDTDDTDATTTTIDGDGGDAGSDGEGESGDAGSGSSGSDDGTATASGTGSEPAPSGGQSGSGGGSTDGGGDAGAPLESGALQPTAVGRYTYDVRGTQTIGSSTSDLPPTSTLEVKAASGNRQRQIQTSEDGSSVVDLLFEFRADGVYVVELTQSQSGQSFTWKFATPQLAAPAVPTTGQKWSWPKTDDTKGTTALEVSFEILGTEKLTVGGQAVDTTKLKLEFTTSGNVESTTTGTRWISAEHRITVKDQSETTGSFGVINFSGQSTATLRSLSPS